ncbi:response regulator transcription factor [Streptosporangium sp. NPDC006013]|uniref:response regulator transcription factor n=1 Tax=Streptosporangium sp. NPDC006013 TaxID=3155596 RepID=UPI0033B151E5
MPATWGAQTACLDIRMPGRDGIRVAQALCGAEAANPIPVLVLTIFALDEYIFGALEAGVSGFLLKDADAEQIVDAVRSVSQGQGTIDSSLTRRVIREFAQRRRLHPVTPDRADTVLTAREIEILLLLARGMSNDDIASELHVEVSTVKSHLARMLPRIGVRSRLQAVVWAYQNRVVRVADEEEPAPASKDAKP